jgi:hypothetical protein
MPHLMTLPPAAGVAGQRGAGVLQRELAGRRVHLGFGRTAVSKTAAPIILAQLVESGRAGVRSGSASDRGPAPPHRRGPEVVGRVAAWGYNSVSASRGSRRPKSGGPRSFLSGF